MNLADVLFKALEAAGFAAQDSDCPAADPLVLVVAQKVVSKAEGSLVRLDEVRPSPLAIAWTSRYERDPRLVEVVLQQARRIVRMERGIIIAETCHGYVCANAGVDASNAPSGSLVLLPQDPDRSAAQLRSDLGKRLSRQMAVIISDTFGRPWRAGLANVALGISGLSPLIDYRGQVDSCGRPLRTSVLAVADELAGAAELVMGKVNRIPAVVIEGYDFVPSEGSGRNLIRPAERDLFR